MGKDKLSLGRRTFGAALWAGAGRGARAITQVVFMIVLGRAIGSAGFAAASIALIGYQLSATLATQSFSMALVRHAAPDDGREAAAFWLNIILIALLTVATTGLGGPVARWLDLPSLVWLLPLLTALGLIAAPTVLAQARMSRAMAFRKIAGIETISSLAGAAAGIIAVLLDAGLAALVVYAAVMRLVEAVGFMRGAYAWPQGRPSFPDIPALLRFTGPLVGMQILTFANGSIDQFFIGRAGTPATLGFYSLARRFSQQPTQMITFAFNRALYPAMVHARESEGGLIPLFMNAVRLSVMGASLPLFLLAVTAQDLLLVAMGPDWISAAPYLTMFAAISAVLPLGGMFAAALRAEGRTAQQLLFQAIRLIVSVIALGIMVKLQTDVFWMAVVVAVLSVLALVLPLWEVTQVLGVSWVKVLLEVAKGLGPALIMVIVVLLSKQWVFDVASPMTRLSAEIMIGLAIGGLIGGLSLKYAKR